MSGLTEGAKRQLGRLVAVVRDELAAHERLAALLAQQEASVARPRSDAFREATLAIEAELARAPHRTQKRETALKAIGAELGVAGAALTLTSLAERFGAGGDALRDERDRLQSIALRTQARTRKVAALVRVHREVTRELLQSALGDEDEPRGDVLSGGTLIDAEV